MGDLITYFEARKLLDDAVKNVRERLEAAYVTATASFGILLTSGDFAGLTSLDMLAAYRYRIASAVLRSWHVGRAALVGLILPQSKKATTFQVSTRNRYAKRSGKRKAFPGDSPNVEHSEKAKGKRAHFAARFVPLKSRKLPKLALLSARKRGRPAVPAEWRLYKRKKAKAAFLARKRLDTSDRRELAGWKQYFRKDTGKGWKEPNNFQAADAALREAKKKVLGPNIAEIARREAEQRAKWKAAH